MRHGISIGGDTDTICAMAGGLAEGLFGIPDELVDEALPFLTGEVVDSLKALYAAADRDLLGIRSAPGQAVNGEASRGWLLSRLLRVWISKK